MKIKNTILLALAIIVSIELLFHPIYRYGTSRYVTITIVDKQYVKKNDGGYYLIFTRHNDVFKNVDSLVNLKFNSSSVYGQLEKGRTYCVYVYGWRIPLFSLYPNIVSVHQNNNNRHIKHMYCVS